MVSHRDESSVDLKSLESLHFGALSCYGNDLIKEECNVVSLCSRRCPLASLRSSSSVAADGVPEVFLHVHCDDGGS